MPPKKKSVSSKGAAVATARAKRSVDLTVGNVNYKAYKAQILERIPPIIVESLFNLYDNAVVYCKNEPGYGIADRFSVFQSMLGEIKEWDDDELTEEAKFFTERAPWLRNALQHILVAQIYFLVSVKNDEYVEAPNFTFDMPHTQDIVRQFMVKAAQKVMSRAKLFDHLVSEQDQECNKLTIEEIVAKATDSAITGMVPMEKIIDAQFGEPRDLGGPAPKKKQHRARGPAAEAAEAPAAVDDGDDEDIDDDEIDQLEQEAARRAEIEQLKRDQAERERERVDDIVREKEEQKTSFARLPGEEHVDDDDSDENTEDAIDRLESMDRDDPLRPALRRKVKRMMARRH